MAGAEGATEAEEVWVVGEAGTVAEAAAAGVERVVGAAREGPKAVPAVCSAPHTYTLHHP